MRAMRSSTVLLRGPWHTSSFLVLQVQIPATIDDYLLIHLFCILYTFAAVRKLVKSPPENSTFLGKCVEYHSILETEMPDFSPHELLVRGLPRNQSVPSALPFYLNNSCGVSPIAVDVSEDVARVTFEDGQGQTLFTGGFIIYIQYCFSHYAPVHHASRHLYLR